MMVEFESNIEQHTSTTEVTKIGDTYIEYTDKSSRASNFFRLKIEEKVNFVCSTYWTNYGYDISGWGDKSLSPLVVKQLAVFITHLHTLNEQEQVDVLNSINGDK